ncbi:MAG: hypothetical protein AAB592_00575 [Patescibacteria group bacterium]
MPSDPKEDIPAHEEEGAANSQTEEVSSGEIDALTHPVSDSVHDVLNSEESDTEKRSTKMERFLFMPSAKKAEFIDEHATDVYQSFKKAFSPERGLEYPFYSALEEILKVSRMRGSVILYALLDKTREALQGGANMYFMSSILQLAVKNGGSEAFEALEIVENYLEQKDTIQTGNDHHEVRSFVAKAITSKESTPQIAKKAKEIIARYLYSLDIPGYLCIDTWIKNDKSKSKENAGANISAHLASIAHLERKAPGAAGYLSSTCGVFFFRRYSSELLKNIYLERDDKEKPYGIIFYPHDDHNGAFTDEKGNLEKLRQDLADRGYALRLVETGDLSGFENAARMMAHRYGAKNKIGFAVVGGHGTPNTIQLGSNYSFDSEKFIEKLEQIRGLFVDDCQMLFESCSTGASGGIASKVARSQAGFETVAPNIPTSLKKVTVSSEKGHIVLDPEYSDAHSKRVYKRWGQPKAA